MCLITGALSPWGPLGGWPTHFKLRSYVYVSISNNTLLLQKNGINRKKDNKIQERFHCQFNQSFTMSQYFYIQLSFSEQHALPDDNLMVG